MGLGLNKFQGDEGGSETKPVLHRDTKKHPYGNPKWRNFRSSLGLKGMNKNQRERYIEDKNDIAEWNNRPIPELTREERSHQRDLDTEEWLHRKALKRILPMGMYVDDYVNDLKLRQEPSYIEELDRLNRLEYPAHYEKLDAEKAAKAEAEKNQKRYGGDLPKAQVGIPPPGETIIPHESTVGQVQPDFYVDSNSSYEVNSSTNKRGKNKVKNNFLEDTTVTDSDGYSTMSTRSVDNGNKKYKQIFNVYDTENNLLAKSVDKINIFGNPKNRTRVTDKGKEAGYDAKYGGSLPKAQFGFVGDWLSSGTDYVVDAYEDASDTVEDAYNSVADTAGDMLTKMPSFLRDVQATYNPYNYRRTNGSNNPLEAFWSGNFEMYPTYYGDDKDEAFSKARANSGPGAMFLHDGIRYKTDHEGETTHEGSNDFLAKMEAAVKEGTIKPDELDRFKEVWTELGQPELEVGIDEYDNILSAHSWDDLGLRPGDHVNPGTGKLYIKEYKTKAARSWMRAVINELTHVKQQREMGRLPYMTKYLQDLGSGVLETGNTDDAQSSLYDKDGTLENDAHRSEHNLNDVLRNYIYHNIRRSDMTADEYEEALWKLDNVKKMGSQDFKKQYGGNLPKAQFGKGLRNLQQKIRDNRVANTPVRDAGGLDAINMLDSWQPGDENNFGHYDPKNDEIVMWRENAGDEYDDALEHEKIHASQYGPFSRLWYKMNDNGMDPSYKGARIQDKPMRKAYRKLTKGKNQVQDLLLPDNERTFNAAGQYVLNKGEEFEAVLSTGINAAQKHGINFDGSFDDILSQLNTIPEEERSNNLRGLTKFMSNAFTEEQKEIIFKSLIQQGR